jgi:hypothetical protein
VMRGFPPTVISGLVHPRSKSIMRNFIMLSERLR